MKKSGFYVILGVLAIIFISPTVFGEFMDFFKLKDGVTGKVTQSDFNVSIVLNVHSIIVSTIPTQTITEAGPTNILFWFLVNNSDGVANINTSNAVAKFQKQGETTRSNLTCTNTTRIGTTAINFTCEIAMWYFDGAGTWTINVSNTDINQVYVENASTSFTLQSTTSMNLSTISVAFTGVGLNTKNKTANSPVVIQNFANSGLNVTVNATLLRGVTDSTKAIFAENFTMNSTGTGCDGAALANNTKIYVPGLNITRGNFSTNAGGIGNITFCLKDIPPSATSQTYSTLNSRAWTVVVAGY